MNIRVGMRHAPDAHSPGSLSSQVAWQLNTAEAEVSQSDTTDFVATALMDKPSSSYRSFLLAFLLQFPVQVDVWS